ncbi:MAG TPA: hypothetical protein VGM56_01750 [Byssovorax sp.]
MGCAPRGGEDEGSNVPQNTNQGQFANGGQMGTAGQPGTAPYAANPAQQPQNGAVPGAQPAAAPGFPALPVSFPFPGAQPAQQPSQAPAQGASQPQANNGAFPIPNVAWPFPGAQGSPQQQGGSAGAATPIDPNVASVATVPLMAYAVQEAPNMNREGGTIAGQFREGQTLEQPFQLAPNKCYTVLAVGAGVLETDISIVAVTPIPAQSPVLANDNTSGPNASLGGRGNCYRWQAPIGINAKFVVRATRGMGIIAAQMYAK